VALVFSATGCSGPTLGNLQLDQRPSSDQGLSLGNLEFQVRSQNQSLASVDLTLSCESPIACEQDPASVMTNGEGSARLSAIRPGRYSLFVRRPGFLPMHTGVIVLGGLDSAYRIGLDRCLDRECAPKAIDPAKLVVCE
jgi:hypothetical protein